MDVWEIRVVNDVVLINKATFGNIFDTGLIDGDFVAGDNEIGDDTNFTKAGNGVLGGLGFEFTDVFEVGKVSDHGEDGGIFFTDFTGGVEEGHIFEVAGGAANFDNSEVIPRSLVIDKLFNFVDDIGDELGITALIEKGTLFLDDILKDFTSSNIVFPGEIKIKITLVVAKVLVDFATVVGDKDFAVFGGAHGSGIDTDVGIDFNGSYFKSLIFEKEADRGSNNAFAKAG